MTDEEGEGGEEVEQRAYANVRQLEAAATATRKLAGRRKLRALPPVPTTTSGTGSSDSMANETVGGPGGAAVVAEKMPLSGNEPDSAGPGAQDGHGSSSVKLQGFFAVSRGRQTGKCAH